MSMSVDGSKSPLTTPPFSSVLMGAPAGGDVESGVIVSVSS